MIYCQDCGATNDPSNPTCRVCGQALQFQPSTLRCSACSQFVGIGAAFCSACGASADDVALGAVADGGTPPNEAAIDALLATPAPANSRVATAPAPSAETFDLGAGLELPDWLKRAANRPQHPASPTAAPGTDSAPSPTSGAELAPPAPDDQVPALAGTFAARAGSAPSPGQPGPGAATPGPASRLHAAAAPAAPAATPEAPSLPPLPDGGLASTMPSWLRPGTGPGSTGMPSAAPPPVDHRRSLADDPTDTASFITENDLPNWLRQLAAAEAAQAEDARRAEESARLAAEESATEAASRQAVAATEPGAATPTPAQDAVAAPTTQGAVAGRWLARREGAEGAGSGRRSAFEDLVQEQVAEQETIAEAVTPVAARSIPNEELASSWAALQSSPDSAASTVRQETGGTKRWLVIVALLLIIAALLAYLFAGGQLG